jgi:hypothetical protein
VRRLAERLRRLPWRDRRPQRRASSLVLVEWRRGRVVDQLLDRTRAVLFHTLEVGRDWHWRTPGRTPSDRRVEATSVERFGPAQASAQSAAIGANGATAPSQQPLEPVSAIRYGAVEPPAHGARAAWAGPRLAAETVHGSASSLGGC